MAEQKDTSGCARRGCLGCLVVVGGVIVVGLLLVFVQSLRPRPEARPTERQLVHELPALPAEATPADDEAMVEEAMAGEPPVEAEPGATPIDPTTVDPRELPGLARESEPVRLELDLAEGTFIIEPVAAGQPLTVTADYDAARYELEESWDEARRLYRVRFASTGRGWKLFGRRPGGQSEVRIQLPRGYPLAIVGEVGVGQSRLEFGGLWLTDIDLAIGVGDHELSFSEPLAVPLPSLVIDGEIGDLELVRVGNASPAQVRLEHTIGAVAVDLRGAWQRDAEISVRCGIGECRIELPDAREVRSIVDRASVGIGESRVDPPRDSLGADDDRPVLLISASARLGELRIRD